MSPVKQQLMSRLELLPDRRLSEVLDFVEFIASRRDDSDEPLLSLSGTLKATPLSAEALEAELYGPGGN